MFTQRREQVPDEDAIVEEIPAPEETPAASENADADEAVVEEVVDEDEETKEPEPVKMKDILVDNWLHLNSQAPLWQRYLRIIPFEPERMTEKDFTGIPRKSATKNTKPFTKHSSSLTRILWLGTISQATPAQVYLSKP